MEKSQKLLEKELFEKILVVVKEHFIAVLENDDLFEEKISNNSLFVWKDNFFWKSIDRHLDIEINISRHNPPMFPVRWDDIIPGEIIALENEEKIKKSKQRSSEFQKLWEEELDKSLIKGKTHE
jgi:hypothetical protein